MIATGVLFYLTTSACSPVNDACEEAVLTIHTSQEVCELVILEERIFNGQCLPVEGIARQ